MSTAGQGLRLVRRKPSCRITIARGPDVRAFTIRPWIAVSLTLLGAVFTTLYLLATGYLVFRDDLLAASLARQVRQQQAYEDRIASLRSEIDRLTSRQLLNQEAFEAKLAQIAGKQANLDARQDIIAALTRAARSAGIVPNAETAPVPIPNLKPSVGPDDSLTTGSIEPAGARAPLAYAALREATVQAETPGATGPVARIGAVETSLAALSRDQVEFVEAMADTVAGQSTRLAGVLKTLGRPVPASPDDEEDVGGPFVPLDANADSETFRTNVALITDEIERLGTLRRIAMKLPIARPIEGAAITSRFGARRDPFVGRLAMHTGIDFRSPTADPVRSTAPGTVLSAGYAGGYGYMVEIDHGNGVTTRYAHLSRLLVKAGDVIPAGAVVGRTGSTGRSTGPHLHYEVRIDGKATDPMTYIKAGEELTALL